MITLSQATLDRVMSTQTSSIADAKKQHKKEFLQRCGWQKKEKHPLLCIPTGLKAEEAELFASLVEGLLSLPLQIAILGKGSKRMGELCEELHAKYADRVAIVEASSEHLQDMLLASDIGLYLGGVSNEDKELCLEHGTVPVAGESTPFEAYDPNGEAGYGFLFGKHDIWNVFATVVRALETYRFPYDWRTMVKNAKEKAGIEG